MATVGRVKLWEKGKELDTSMRSQECQCNWQTAFFNVKFIGLSGWAIWALSPPNWLHSSGFLSVSVTGYQSVSAPLSSTWLLGNKNKTPTFYPFLCIQRHYFRGENYAMSSHRNRCVCSIEGEQALLTHAGRHQEVLSRNMWWVSVLLSKALQWVPEQIFDLVSSSTQKGQCNPQSTQRRWWICKDKKQIGEGGKRVKYLL